MYPAPSRGGWQTLWAGVKRWRLVTTCLPLSPSTPELHKETFSFIIFVDQQAIAVHLWQTLCSFVWTLKTLKGRLSALNILRLKRIMIFLSYICYSTLTHGLYFISLWRWWTALIECFSLTCSICTTTILPKLNTNRSTDMYLHFWEAQSSLSCHYKNKTINPSNHSSYSTIQYKSPDVGN